MLSKHQESVEDLQNEIVWEDVLDFLESEDEDSALSKHIDDQLTRENIK